MRYQTKSIIIGRKKREGNDEEYPCFIALYSVSAPHLSGKVPDQILEYPRTHKVVITKLDVCYLLGGNDLVIDNLGEIEIKHENGHIYLTGRHQTR